MSMELDRPHRPASASTTTTTTSDLFICFTSRLSHSSSMRMSSKSILSPGRSDKPPISLSTSLSRRLRRSNNGSLKGGQSPMFPPGVNSKKRGCAFENPEPSSPKVTCIGQVRVKTKKQGKKMKMAYRTRRITTTINERNHELKEGESKNQSWVQFPVTICDAFSCFIPCKSGEGNKGEKRENSSSSSSCYRWFVAFNEGGGEGKTRDIEIVVGEEEGRMEEERVVMEREVSRRRSIFDDMDFNVDEICDGGEGENEGSRVSVCVPPKNALLLMRCRSDPVKMSALVNKFWESPTKEDDEEEEEEIEEKRRSSVREDEKIEAFSNCDELVVREEAEDEKIESLSNSDGAGEDQKLLEGEDEVKEEENGESAIEDVDQGRISVSVSDEDGFMNLAMLFEEKEDPDGMEKKEARDFGQTLDPPESTPPIEHFQEEEEDLVEIQETVVGKDSIFELTEEDSNDQKPPLERREEEEIRVAVDQSRSEEQSPISSEEEEDDDEEEEKHFEAMEKPVLPDCLLLMMCEPKLSMEVSKETWVCSTDFLRPWLPERHRQHQLKKLTGGGDEPNSNKKKKSKKNRGGNTVSIPPLPPAAAAAPFQPPRSSCSFPISMASLIEKKLVSAVAYEPFVLTRCKSEPMRTASAKLGAPQEVACFWKNSKIEPHRPATCGIGAAGVGF